MQKKGAEKNKQIAKDYFKKCETLAKPNGWQSFKETNSFEHHCIINIRHNGGICSLWEQLY